MTKDSNKAICQNQGPAGAGRDLIFLGSGGHFRSILEIAVSLRRIVRGVVLGPDITDCPDEKNGVKVLGSQSSLGKFLDPECEFLVAFGYIGGAQQRAKLFSEAKDLGFQPATLVAPSAIVASNAIVAEGCTIHPLSFVNSGASIGVNCIVNSGAIVEHDTRVGDHSQIAPRALLCGMAEVGEGCYIGAGAVVLEGRKVGDYAIVGAGAVVIQDVPPGAKVVGVPARVI